MSGFIILAGYGIMLSLIYLILRKKGNIDKYSVNHMIFAGGQVRSGTLICTVFASWMWTTSILGSIETYQLYGVWGPVGYVGGACIAFFLFVLFLTAFRKKLPEMVTYLGFIELRFGRRVKYFFYMFAFIISAYVLVEQAVGIASVLETFFGCSFKLTAFFSVMLAMGFICLGGMRSLLVSEWITTIAVIAGFIAFGVYFITTDTDPIGVASVLAGWRPGLSPMDSWLTETVLIPGFQYFIMATVIAFSQLVFDTGYYLKGNMARSTAQLRNTYLIAGVLLWGAVSFVSAVYLGRASVQNDMEILGLFLKGSAVLFAILMVFIGISTIEHYLMGLLGIFTTDLYETLLRPQANEHQKLVFGRVMVIAAGVFCALVAISLEDISLLTIDVFCAIFFAAPCGPLLVGFFSKRRFSEGVPIAATVSGIIGGLIVWTVMPSTAQQNQFWGMGASIALPLIIMFLSKVMPRIKGDKTEKPI